MRENIGLYRGKPKTSGDYFFFSQNWEDNCEEGFVYGNLIVSKGKYYICVSAMCKLNCCINNGTVSMIEVVPETIGEYTGLTDRNNKKIFEGDIVKDNVSVIYEIIYDEANFQKKDIDLDYGYVLERSTDLIVIGNIYDNSKLLK